MHSASRLFSLTAAIILLASGNLFAQVHPCDAPDVPQVIQSGAPHSVLFCALSADAIEAAAVYVDGQPFDLVPVTAISGVSSTGWVLYESADVVQVAKGSHTVAVATYNRSNFSDQLQLGEKSFPLSFAGDDERPLPHAPVVRGVAR